MKHQEHDLQAAIVRYLRYSGVTVFAVPNGGHRNVKTAVNLKAEGVMPGVADLIILLPNRCIFVEVKTDSTQSKQQQTQKDFEQIVKALGFEYYIWRSVDDAIGFMETT